MGNLQRKRHYVVQTSFTSQPPATVPTKDGSRRYREIQGLLEASQLRWCTFGHRRLRHLRLPTRTGTHGPLPPIRMERIPMVEHPKQELRLVTENDRSSTLHP